MTETIDTTRDIYNPEYEAARREPVFRLENVTKNYDGPSKEKVCVLSDVSLNISNGITAILGPSGCGKTTLLNLLGGVDSPDTGNVIYNNRPLLSSNQRDLAKHRRHHVAWVFQDLNLISHLSVAKNVAMPLVFKKAGRQETRQRVEECLTSLELGSLRHRYPHQLSRGQKQRVAIARALAGDAKVILTDEPTGSLDVESATLVMESFKKALEGGQSNKTIVIVTHNRQLAHEYADFVYEYKERRFALSPELGKLAPRSPESNSPNEESAQ